MTHALESSQWFAANSNSCSIGLSDKPEKCQFYYKVRNYTHLSVDLKKIYFISSVLLTFDARIEFFK